MQRSVKIRKIKHNLLCFHRVLKVEEEALEVLSKALYNLNHSNKYLEVLLLPKITWVDLDNRCNKIKVLLNSRIVIYKLKVLLKDQAFLLSKTLDILKLNFLNSFSKELFNYSASKCLAFKIKVGVLIISSLSLLK